MIRRLLSVRTSVAALFAGLALVVALGLGLGLSAPPLRAQPASSAFSPAQRAEIVQILRQAMKQDPSILRDAITALQDDEASRKEGATQQAITALRRELTGNPADPQAGNPKGSVTVVEFYDVRCPYCRRMLPVMAELLKRDPDIRLVYKDIPILGPPSVLGAQALLAAQKQGGYAKLYEILMTGDPTIDMDVLQKATQRAGLDWARLRQDMDSADVKARIAANLALAHRLSIEGTPAYVIGGQMLPGAVDLAELQQAVAAARRE
jgi:protein-disulfide isomerase